MASEKEVGKMKAWDTPLQLRYGNEGEIVYKIAAQQLMGGVELRVSNCTTTEPITIRLVENDEGMKAATLLSYAIMSSGQRYSWMSQKTVPHGVLSRVCNEGTNGLDADGLTRIVERYVLEPVMPQSGRIGGKDVKIHRNRRSYIAGQMAAMLMHPKWTLDQVGAFADEYCKTNVFVYEDNPCNKPQITRKAA